MAEPVNSPYLVVGEGKRDKIFLECLAKYRGIASIQFEGATGYTGFANHLKGSWAARTGFDKLKGLVLVGDNDPNEGKTFVAIRDQLRKVGLASPPRPLAIARKQDSPPVAIVMMPFDGSRAERIGALESLLLPAIEQAHPNEAKCYGDMYSCINANEWRSQSSRDKLKVRCILSSSCESNPMCGVDSWFSPNHPLIPLDHVGFQAIADLLSKLNDWFESGIDDWPTFSGANP